MYVPLATALIGLHGFPRDVHLHPHPCEKEGVVFPYGGL
jgi:hypothetical protein